MIHVTDSADVKVRFCSTEFFLPVRGGKTQSSPRKINARVRNWQGGGKVEVRKRRELLNINAIKTVHHP